MAGGKLLGIDSLLLDQANPRIREASGQRDAIQKIANDQDAKLAVLAEHIVKNGLNPMDRFLVVKSEAQKTKFFVLEGNRRLAALKMLRKPAILGGISIKSALRARLERAAAIYDHSIKSVPCFQVDDRSDAEDWIKQRHTGENKGAGIVDWGGEASDRFRGSSPGLQALDLVRFHGGLSPDEREEAAENFPVSTLNRLLRTPSVRALLGVTIVDKKLQSALPAAEVLRPLRRIVVELAKPNGINVNDLKSRDQQRDWVQSLGSDLPDLTKAQPTAKSVESFDETNFPRPTAKPASEPSATGTKPTRQTKPKPPPVTMLVPSNCILDINVPKIEEIFKELRDLPPSKFPHAVSVLLRVFLEQSVDAYIERTGGSLLVSTHGGNKPKQLRAKVAEVITALVAAGASTKDFDGLSKGINDRQSPLSMDTFNAYVHNRHYSPMERDLVVSWNNLQVFFERVWPWP